MEPGITLLQALVDESNEGHSTGSGISKYIRTLYIDSLSPSASLESDAEFEERLGKLLSIYELETKSKSWVLTKHMSESIATAETKLLSLLEPALMSLDNLDAVRYVTFLLFPLVSSYGQIYPRQMEMALERR